MGFNTVEKDLIPILEYNSAARADDMTLYAEYVYGKVKNMKCQDNWLVKVFSDRQFRIACGVVPYGTVSRIRRKIQKKRPDLCPTEAEKKEKKKLEQNYKAYAKEKKNE